MPEPAPTADQGAERAPRSRYRVKEIYRTLQGEGYHTGRAAVFCRFTSCNLWTGHEKDRERAVCQFCDTDFVGTDGPGGGRFSDPDDLADAITRAWGPSEFERRFVVLTGGEPLLQVDQHLLSALRARRFIIACETNGTRPRPTGISWLTVSPKAGAPLVLEHAQELKVVYPQPGLDPSELIDWFDADKYYIQPMDGPDHLLNTELSIQFVQRDPRWQLSLQTHKYLGIP
jgi:7-carboxy-7-deazaguanine synthase